MTGDIVDFIWKKLHLHLFNFFFVHLHNLTSSSSYLHTFTANKTLQGKNYCAPELFCGEITMKTADIVLTYKHTIRGEWEAVFVLGKLSWLSANKKTVLAKIVRPNRQICSRSDKE